MNPRRERAIDALALVGLKLAVGACVLHAGFTHVSDDDYARTVIAEQFARTPALDPSGTSWLPVPFWLTGGAMLVAGRSLGVAHAVALALGAACVVAPYLAMRAVGMRRGPALVATAFAMTMPWNVWLGVSTVPEGWTGAIVGAAMIAMGAAASTAADVDATARRAWAAAGLLAGALSRYETWPACAVLAALCGLRAVRAGQRGAAAWRLDAASVAVALAGPIAWMAWNAHAHGDALHFVARVTRFRQAIGAADVPLADKLLDYPRALALDLPVASALGILGVAGLVSPALRARWGWPGAAVVATLVFLVWGDARDGAPTHHAARALVGVAWVLVAAGIDTLVSAHDRAVGRELPARSRMAVVALATLAGVVSLVGRPRPPGSTEVEDRAPQLARGADLRARGVRAARLVPCAFEHFAVLAAWGAPERAVVEPRTDTPPTADCPRIVELDEPGLL